MPLFRLLMVRDSGLCGSLRERVKVKLDLEQDTDIVAYSIKDIKIVRMP